MKLGKRIDFYAYWNWSHFSLLPNLEYDKLCDSIHEVSFSWFCFQTGIVIG